MTFEPLFLVPKTAEEWRDWLGDSGVNVIAIVIGLVLVRLLVTRVIGRVIRSAALRAARARAEDPALVERRVDTLLATISWIFTIFLALIGSALLLDQFDVQVSALIAGVGVAGIAIGLGTQTLIKDVINGMFILIEGQYAVGDVVNVAGIGGQVIEITPRRTVLRDQNGHVHVIPNSAITVATNMTQGFSRINLNVSVAYEEDIDHVTEVINDECQKLADEFPMDIIVAPKVLRVDALGADGIEIKIIGDVKVFRQWDLMGELRKRLKARFDEESIEIPYRREVHVQFADLVAKRSGRAIPQPTEPAE